MEEGKDELLEKTLRTMDHELPDRELSGLIMQRVSLKGGRIRERKDYTRWLPLVLAGSFGIAALVFAILLLPQLSQITIPWQDSRVQLLVGAAMVGIGWLMVQGFEVLLRRSSSLLSLN